MAALTGPSVRPSNASRAKWQDAVDGESRSLRSSSQSARSVFTGSTRIARRAGT